MYNKREVRLFYKVTSRNDGKGVTFVSGDPAKCKGLPFSSVMQCTV